MLYTFAAYATFYELYVGLLKALIGFAICLSMVISADRLLKVAQFAQYTLRTALTGQKPEQRFACNPLPDPAQYSLVYPRVAVQLPMFNERAVCQAIIDSACELSWPRERFKVQVNALLLQVGFAQWLLWQGFSERQTPDSKSHLGAHSLLVLLQLLQHLHLSAAAVLKRSGCIPAGA